MEPRILHAEESSRLTSIFDSLASLTPPTETHPSSLHASSIISPLHTLSDEDSERARSLFLTLHVLFPHELLPALDLLDRGLVTGLTPLDAPNSSTGTTDLVTGNVESSLSGVAARHQPPLGPSESTTEVLFYIQSSGASSASSSSRYHRKHTSGAAPFYEVRLDSWNCTCPAFSVSAFQSLNVNHEREPQPPWRWSNENDKGEPPSWRFGGVATSTSSTSNRRPPSCKHILAAVLAKAAPRLFDYGITSRVVSRDEIAGWGAGWGEFGSG
ncbi:hypothetical protein RBB50_001933 [Rhinocladiella similis]